MSKARHWCVTGWHDGDIDFSRDPHVVYAVWQFERGHAADRLHCQAYIQFDNSYTMARCKKLLGNDAHCEIARGTPAECKAYCTKDDTREHGPYEYGTMLSQGDRLDIKQVVTKVKTLAVSMSNWEDVYASLLEEDPNAHKFAFMVKTLHTSIQRNLPRPDKERKIVLLWGEAGQGKSRWARDRYGRDNVYDYDWKSGWFQGYRGQKCIILEEYDKSPGSIEWLKKAADRYSGVNYPVKNGSCFNDWDIIVVTSNMCLKSLLGDAGILRRCALARQFKADGVTVDHVIEVPEG